MKALITGVAGFVGSHLAEHLMKNNIEVYGFYLKGTSTENVSHLKELHLYEADVQDRAKITKILGTIKPNYVFHLAAFSSPAQSFKNPRETMENNIFGELNLLEALVELKSKAKVLIIGSSDEYGIVDAKNLPVTEEAPLAPTSPYAVSKVAQDILGLQFFLHENLHIVRLRPFNHIGPRQAPVFVVPSFASQIAKLEKLGGGTIKVGNLSSSRDFTDVRDIVRAYLLALEKGKAGEVYNLGSGKAIKIEKVLKILLSFSNVKINVEIDKDKFLPIDTKIIYCDNSKFKKQTGWEPKIPITQSLFDTIEYERSKLN